MRRLVVASAILAILLTWPLAQAVAIPRSTPAAIKDSDRAGAALEYLLVAQRADGSIDASLGETADFVIGAAAAGYDPATLHGCVAGTGALDFLATASDAAWADPARTGKAVLAVVAAGGDPGSFHGRNLIARLDATYHVATGAYGDGSTFSQSFAILGLRAAGRSVPAAALAELKALQGPDGSWSYGTAPVAAGGGDTNSAAIALMALDAAGEHSADKSALAYLATQQVADGGFVYSSAWGSKSDPDSDAMVLQAILSSGGNPEATGWKEGPATVLTHLRTAQAADGGFAYPGSGESAFTTSQIPAALMRVWYGAAVSPTSGRSLPTTSCAGPRASPTARPTSKPTIRPTARPTIRPTARPTVRPSVRPTAKPTIEPTATPISTSSPTPTSTPTAAVPDSTASGDPPPARSDSGSTDGLPPPVLYGLAALAALAAVIGGGWVLMSRPRSR